MTATTANKTTTSLRTQVWAMGNALSLLLAISFLLCIGWGLVTPNSMHMHDAWTQLLPEFRWLTPIGFILGLIEAYLYGWYITFVFAPLYWFFQTHECKAKRFRPGAGPELADAPL